MTGDALVAEPVAQSLFRQLFGFEVMPHRQTAREKHRRKLGRCLADFRVEGFRFLHDQHTQLRLFATQENRGGRAAECPAEDHDVITIHGRDANTRCPRSAIRAPRELLRGADSEARTADIMRAACSITCSRPGCSSSSTGATSASS